MPPSNWRSTLGTTMVLLHCRRLVLQATCMVSGYRDPAHHVLQHAQAHAVQQHHLPRSSVKVTSCPLVALPGARAPESTAPSHRSAPRRWPRTAGAPLSSVIFRSLSKACSAR